MKAVRIHTRGTPDGLIYEDAPKPRPGEGEVLVSVYATGITPAELRWPGTWKTKAGTERVAPIIPGHDLSGVVAQVGSAVTDVAVGDAVFGLIDFARNGAEAEYTIALPSELASKPRTLNHVQAAVVPLASLTAWQALFDHGDLGAGQSVLIHGAAGSVGAFAVQFAKWAGAHVYGTASGRDGKYLGDLGLDVLIDDTTTPFDELLSELNIRFDVVLDTVGGDTLERSWSVLRLGGTLVSIAASPSQERASAEGVHAVWFVVRPSGAELARIGDLIDSGVVRSTVSGVFPLSQAHEAYIQGMNGHRRGKLVLQVAG